jgi:single-stranded DNA-binding protein
MEYCRKGDLVGVKGRLETETIIEEDIKKYVMYVVAEKVSFLSSNKQDMKEV